MKGSFGERTVGSQSEPLLGGSSYIVAAAHELKEPLALIRQLSLSLESTRLDADEQVRMIQQITLTSERALRLTTALSRASRLDDSFFACEPLNPFHICEEVAHELAPLYAAKGRTIRVPGKRRPVILIANRELLRRILLNFGDNALQYTDADAPVELKTSLLSGGEAIRVGVRDYGPALPSKVWQRLQHTLGTGAQPLHARPQSSGLGLYVAGQFARAMDGRIGTVRHHDGATFYVELHASRQLKLL